MVILLYFKVKSKIVLYYVTDKKALRDDLDCILLSTITIHRSHTLDDLTLNNFVRNNIFNNKRIIKWPRRNEPTPHKIQITKKKTVSLQLQSNKSQFIILMISSNKKKELSRHYLYKSNDIEFISEYQFSVWTFNPIWIFHSQPPRFNN